MITPFSLSYQGKYGNSDNFPDSNIYVDVFNKSVLLTGQVKDDAQNNLLKISRAVIRRN